MKKRIELIKHLLWRISSSTAMTWLLLLVVIVGMIFNIFSLTFYKTALVMVIFALLFVNVNITPVTERPMTIEEIDAAINKIRASHTDIEEEIKRRNDDK